jgi:hypothetical protein
VLCYAVISEGTEALLWQVAMGKWQVASGKLAMGKLKKEGQSSKIEAQPQHQQQSRDERSC